MYGISIGMTPKIVLGKGIEGSVQLCKRCGIPYHHIGKIRQSVYTFLTGKHPLCLMPRALASRKGALNTKRMGSVDKEHAPAQGMQADMPKQRGVYENIASRFLYNAFYLAVHNGMDQRFKKIQSLIRRKHNARKAGP
jgi:hypothetical protein